MSDAWYFTSPKTVKVLVLDTDLNEEKFKEHFPEISLVTPIPFDQQKIFKKQQNQEDSQMHATEVLLALSESYVKQTNNPKGIEIIAAPMLPGLVMLTNDLKKQLQEKSALPIECPIKQNEIDIVNMSLCFSIPNLMNDTMPKAALQFINDTRKWLEYQATKGRNGKGTVLVGAVGNKVADDPNLHLPKNSRYVTVIGGHNTSEAIKQGKFYAPSMGPNIVGSLPLYEERKTTDQAGTSLGAADASALMAELIQTNPNLTALDLKEILILTSKNTHNARNGQRLNEDPDKFMVNNPNINGIGAYYEAANGFGHINRQSALDLARTWDDHRTYNQEKRIEMPVKFYPAKEQTVRGTVQLTQFNDLQIRDVRLNIEFAQSNIRQTYVNVELSPTGIGSAFLDGDIQGVKNHQVDGLCFYGQPVNSSFLIEVKDMTKYGDAAWQAPRANLTIFAAPRPDTIYFNEDAKAMPKISGREMVVPISMQKIDCAAIHSDAVHLDLAKSKGKIFNQTFDIRGAVTDLRGSNSDKGDKLIGDQWHNNLRGNRGPDQLFGGKGKDVYSFIPEDGPDIVIDPDYAIISLEKGYKAENVMIKIEGRDVVIYPCQQMGNNLVWNKIDNIRVAKGLDIKLYVVTAGEAQGKTLKPAQVTFENAKQQHSYTTLIAEDSPQLCLPEGCRLLNLAFEDKASVKTAITQTSVLSNTETKALFGIK